MRETKNLKTVEIFAVRIIASWLSALTLLALLRPEGVFAKEYGKQHALLIGVMFVGIFCAFTLINLLRRDAKAFDYIMLLIASVISGTVYSSYLQDYIFTAAAFGFICVAGLFCFSGDRLKLPERDMGKRFSIGTIAVIAAFAAVFIGGFTILRFLTFRAPNYDFGIFVNMFHNMSTKLAPLVSSERDSVLSHFAVHLSPIYYLLLPFYMISPYPQTLLVLQMLAIVSGVIPLRLLAKKYGISNFVTVLICAVYLIYPAFIGGAFFDFHENKLLTVIILWFFYFAEKRKIVLMYVFVLLLCMVKEDAPVYAAILGIYLLISKKEYVHGPIISAGAVAYFIFAVALLEGQGQGVMTWRYNNISSGGFVGIIGAVIANPFRVLGECLKGDKLLYILQTMLPLMFLPLMTRKTSRYILLIPYVLVNLMSDYGYQHSIYYQYSYGTGAMLFYLTVCNIADLKPDTKRYVAIGAAIALIMSFSTTMLPKTYYIKQYFIDKEEIAVINSVLKQIPENASVSSSTFLLPHIAQRELVFEHPSKNTTDYIVFDLRWRSEGDIHVMTEQTTRDGYRLVVVVEDTIALFIKK